MCCDQTSSEKLDCAFVWIVVDGVSADEQGQLVKRSSKRKGRRKGQFPVRCASQTIVCQFQLCIDVHYQAVEQTQLSDRWIICSALCFSVYNHHIPLVTTYTVFNYVRCLKTCFESNDIHSPFCLFILAVMPCSCRMFWMVAKFVAMVFWPSC